MRKGSLLPACAGLLLGFVHVALVACEFAWIACVLDFLISWYLRLNDGRLWRMSSTAVKMDVVWCAHCKVNVGNRSRGLCSNCHDDLRVRKLYPPRKGGGKPCRHCRTRPAWKGRGLCNTCWADTSIRYAYTQLRPTAATVSAAASLTDSDLAECEPTSAMPGTLAKIEVLEARVAARQKLWHPADAQERVRLY